MCGTKNINVLYLHETSQISGAENSLLNLLKKINKDRFRPYFILPSKGIFSEALKNMGSEIRFIEFPRIRNLIRVLPTVKKIRRLVREYDIRLLHSNSIRTHIYAALVGRIEKIPVIWHQRNLISGELIDPDRIFAFLPDKIICNSFSISQRFMRADRLPANVHVVHNGVDTSQFSPALSGRQFRNKLGIRDDEIVIGITSRLGPDKGHETFLQAAALLNEYSKNSLPLKFLIAGDAVFEEDRWRENYLHNLAQHHCISEKTIFCGYCDNMPEVYAAIDIFVLASWAEPAGRVILEAMAMAKPIVATNTGGTPEMISNAETGILISPKDPFGLARALFYLVKNRDVAARMGQAARKKTETDFNLDKNTQEIEKIYMELV